VTQSHLRCFWRWPIGHQWERIVEGQYAYKRCSDCGKSKGGGVRILDDTPRYFGGE
jgi:hypothetical protein